MIGKKTRGIATGQKLNGKVPKELPVTRFGITPQQPAVAATDRLNNIFNRIVSVKFHDKFEEVVPTANMFPLILC